MNELTQTKLNKPLDKLALGDDVAALNNLVGFLNSPLSGGEDRAPGEASLTEAMGGTLPDAESQAAQAAANPKARQPKGNPNLVIEPKIAPVVSTVAEPAAEHGFVNLSRVFYTGRLCVGKDYVAALTGATIEGFALPLYALAKYFFGVDVTASANKDLPGMRAFLQTAGQWGRAFVSTTYPYSAARAAFIQSVRHANESNAFPQSLGVDWPKFGADANLWLNAALVRLEANNPERVAITNVRFANESAELLRQGFSNWHVMTSPEEWAARLAQRRIPANSPVLKDTSEEMAANLDRQVVSEISRSRTGRKLRVIWNSAKPCPSARLWTVNDFLSAAQVSPAAGHPEGDSGVFLGE